MEIFVKNIFRNGRDNEDGVESSIANFCRVSCLFILVRSRFALHNV